MAQRPSLSRLISQARSRDLRWEEAQDLPTTKELLPRRLEIETALRRIRRAADATFRAGRKSRPRSLEELDPGGYPVGYCSWICREVLQGMAKDPLFLGLHGRGLRWKHVYVILMGSYFENAIQLGNFHLSPADDSVDVTVPPVDLSPIGEFDYENLESWERYAEVAEEYLSVTVYPNLHFPLLAPLIPFFAVMPSGRLELLHTQSVLALKDVDEGFPRLRHLYSASSPWMQRRLPQALEAALQRHFRANRREAFPIEFRPAAPEEILAGIVPQWEQAKTQPALATGIESLFSIADSLVRQFHEAEIHGRP